LHELDIELLEAIANARLGHVHGHPLKLPIASGTRIEFHRNLKVIIVHLTTEFEGPVESSFSTNSFQVVEEDQSL